MSVADSLASSAKHTDIFEGYEPSKADYIYMKKYDDYIINPEVNIFQIAFRPVKIYIIGEIKNPGLYTLNTSINTRAAKT